MSEESGALGLPEDESRGALEKDGDHHSHSRGQAGIDTRGGANA
ncbi:MAG TPA: hypothetical protein VKB88_47170 [Bryobacteraceae bacterium]|nr:hypothetical protein [Bryobacteraceae bacterium]